MFPQAYHSTRKHVYSGASLNLKSIHTSYILFFCPYMPIRATPTPNIILPQYSGAETITTTTLYLILSIFSIIF
jgi:hypothetical protein